MTNDLIRHLIVIKSGLLFFLLEGWKQNVIQSVFIPTQLYGTVGLSCLCCPRLVRLHLSFTSLLLQNEQRGQPGDLRDVYSARTTCRLACPVREAQTRAHRPQHRHTGRRSVWPEGQRNSIYVLRDVVFSTGPQQSLSWV